MKDVNLIFRSKLLRKLAPDFFDKFMFIVDFTAKPV